MKKPGYLVLAFLMAAWSTTAQAFAQVQAGVQAKTDAQASASKQEQAKPTKTTTKASASGNASTSASARAGGNSAELSSGTVFEATLTKSVDAKKCKQGDAVEAKATKDVKSEGQVVIPKGSKLIGHVTESKARAKGQSESRLGILFDKAVTKDGREIPLNVVIQAVAASQSAVMASTAGNEPIASGAGTGSAGGAARGGGGGLVGGVASTAGATAGAATSTVGGVAGSAGSTVGAAGNTAASAGGVASAAGALSSTSTGVLGLEGMALQTDVVSATQGSVIASTTRNVQLESGTRMMLRAVASTTSQKQQ